MLRVFVGMVLVGGLTGYLTGKYRKRLMRFGPFAIVMQSYCIATVLIVSAEMLAKRMPSEVESAATFIGLTTHLVVAFAVAFFDDDDWGKRFRKKTSERLRKLLDKVKEAVPSPAPRPRPA